MDRMEEEIKALTENNEDLEKQIHTFRMKLNMTRKRLEAAEAELGHTINLPKESAFYIISLLLSLFICPFSAKEDDVSRAKRMSKSRSSGTPSNEVSHHHSVRLSFFVFEGVCSFPICRTLMKKFPI